MDGQQDRLFNYWVFLQAVAHGMATSLINFFVPLWVSRDMAEPLSFSDYQSFAEVVALSCLLSVTVEVDGASDWALGAAPPGNPAGRP